MYFYELTSQSLSTHSIEVTPEGYTAYIYEFDHVCCNGQIRITNGTFYDLPSGSGQPPVWVGRDGKFKYGYQDKITTLTIDPADFSVTPSVTDYLPISTDELFGGYLLRCDGRTLIINADSASENLITEVENPSDKPRMVIISGLVRINCAAASANSYYICGYGPENKLRVLKINPEDDSIVWENNDYDIRHIVSDADDNLVFIGYPANDDSKYVLEKVSPAGVFSEIATLNPFRVLEQLK